MRSFPSRFILEKNRTLGAAPLFILKCPFPATGTIYLADYAVSIPSWEGGVTTTPWIKSWGQVSENISNDLALVNLSTFTVTAIIEQYGYPNLRTILETSGNNVEAVGCELYLAFRDALDDPDSWPQLVWKGNITDWPYVDEQNVTLLMNDLSVRIDKYVGTKLDLASYPDACPDDVGKIMPIVYGPDNMVTCLRSAWGARTTLKAAIGATDTQAYISDSTGLSSPGSVWIDDERVTYGSITTTAEATGTTYRLNSMGRGTGGTTASAHGAGAQVWEYLSSYQSIIADHTLGAIKGIYAAVGGELLQVTSGVTASVIGGKHVLQASQMITVKTTLNDGIAISDGISIRDTTDVDDPGHSHLAPSTLKLYGSGGGHAVDYGNYYNSVTGADLNLYDGSDVTFCKATGTQSNMSYDTARFYVLFPTYTGPAPIAVYAIITHQTARSLDYPQGPVKARTYIGATELDASNTKVTQRIYLGTTVPGAVNVYAVHPNYSVNYELTLTVYEISLEITVASTSNNSAGVAKNGGVSKSGTVAKSGTVTMSGGMATKMVDHFVVKADGWRDASGIIERPDLVARHFLQVYGGWGGAWYSTMWGTYSFSLVIDTYQKLKSWLAKMAWESRSYFRFAPARAEMLIRPDAPSSVRTITDHMIRRQGERTTMKIRRSSADEVINKVQVHYNRNATKSGEDAYRSVTPVATNAASIARHGEKERPELFNFDFVRSDTMAVSVRDFYLAAYANRKRVAEFEAFLDCVDLEFADAVTVTLTDGSTILAEIRSANLEPGNARDKVNDKITITVREY